MATIDLTSGSFSFSLTVNPQFGNDFLHEVVSGTDYFLAGSFRGAVSQGSWTVDVSFANSFNLTYTGTLEADGQTGTATAMSYSFAHQLGQNAGTFSNINIDMTALANMDSSTRQSVLDANLRSYDYTVNGTADGQVIMMTGLSTNTTVYANGGNDVVITDSGHDYIEGGSGNDAIDARLGNDVVYGGEGNDTIVGGEGVDQFYGGADDDRFQLMASSLSAGETYDGGTGADVLALTGGGLFDLTQVTLTAVESIAVEGSTATTVKVLDFAQAALVNPGSTDTTIDIADITVGSGIDAAERVFRLLEAGIDTVTWEVGGVGRTATLVDSDTMRITRPDGTQSDITFDTQTGFRVSAVITDTADVHSYQSVALTYDGSGVLTERMVNGDDGINTQTLYNSSGVRILTAQIDTSDPGTGPSWASITTDYAADGTTRTARTVMSDSGVETYTQFSNGVRSRAIQNDLSNGGTAEAWNDRTINYTASGEMQRVETRFDNGNSRVSTYDQGQIVQDTRFDAATGITRMTGGSGNNILDGGAQTDIIRGGGGNDTITSHGGNDTLTGGDGDDVFVFDSIVAIDNDIITDFGNGDDRLDLQGFGIYTLADLLATGAGHTASQVGADTVIDFEAAGSITLRNLTLGSLTDAHFVNIL